MPKSGQGRWRRLRQRYAFLVTRRPLVILGLDVGDPDQLTTWIGEGRLPTLGSLVARGATARLTGPEMLCEHAVWTTVFSGRSLGDHGYYYYRRLKPGTYELQTITGADIGAPPFWSRFADGSKTCAIVDAPDVLPIAGIDGIQISDWAIHNAPFPARIEPADFESAVRAAGGVATPIDEALESDIDTDRRLFTALMDRLRRKGAVCRAVTNSGRFDLTVAVFSDCHTATHQFWKYRPEAGGPDTDLRHATRSIYEALDEELAALLAGCADDANVCVVGSTGMLDMYPAGDLVAPFCRLLGYQATPAPSAPSMHPLAIARRVMPEWLRVAISRRFPRDVRERLLSDQFRGSTDWAKTTAFGVPSAYTGFVRVNLRGREPQGIVSPGAEYDALVDRLEQDLQELRDPVSGDSPIASIARTARVFGGPPPVLPDLLVEWTPTRYFRDRLVHPRGEITQTKPEFFRDSDHSREGWFVAAGPDITPGPLGALSPMALAPMFLSLMGVETRAEAQAAFATT